MVMVHGSIIFLCELLGSALVGITIGAFILKVSCAFYNLMAGDSAKLNSPSVPRTSESVAETGITAEPKSVLKLKDDWVHSRNVSMPSGVPVPSFEGAMGIVLVKALVSFLTYFILVRVLHLAGTASGLAALRSLPMLLIFYPLNLLILSGVNAVMLPTSFGKGLLVALINLFLNALLAAVLIVIYLAIALAFGLGIPWPNSWF